MVRYCSVYGCLETTYSNRNRKFFRFPSDEQRCKYWIKEIDRMDLKEKDVKTLHTSYFVCELHFADSDRTKRVLKKNAVPTLLLPQLESSGTSKYTQTDISLLCCTCKSPTSADIPSTSQVSNSVLTFENPLAPPVASSPCELVSLGIEQLTEDSPRERKLQLELKSGVKKQKLLESIIETTKEPDMSPLLKKFIHVQKILKLKSQ